MAYFPNGDSGSLFDNECTDCPLGEEPCPVYMVQSTYNYDACNVEVARKILGDLVADDGTCAMKPHVVKLSKLLRPDEAQAWREEQIAAIGAAHAARAKSGG